MREGSESGLVCELAKVRPTACALFPSWHPSLLWWSSPVPAKVTCCSHSQAMCRLGPALCWDQEACFVEYLHRIAALVLALLQTCLFWSSSTPAPWQPTFNSYGGLAPAPSPSASLLPTPLPLAALLVSSIHSRRCWLINAWYLRSPCVSTLPAANPGHPVFRNVPLRHRPLLAA